MHIIIIIDCINHQLITLSTNGDDGDDGDDDDNDFINL